MSNLQAELAYFRSTLSMRFATELANGQALFPDSIRAEVAASPFKHLTPAQVETIVRTLEANFTTTQKRGSSITKDYQPWLANRKTAIDFYYWDRLKRFYLEGDVLPAPVVAILDRDTDDVLDYTGNPVESGTWARRGMVMGHVQSGKTTNYSALICKASDAGYKIIILLAGITNTLRTQTQERLDETYIGKKSIFHATANEPLPLVNYATRRRFPAFGTSRDRDFTPDASRFGFSLAAHNEPIIFILKKNGAVLARLKKWIDEQVELTPEVLTVPLLLIDDEADNASINTNTNPLNSTKINGVIREILHQFDRSTYIGYTATPFANIFIDPDTDARMKTDDLFPRHFIKALDPPSSYVGSGRVFAPEGNLRQTMVRIVAPTDFAGVLPLDHKRDAPVPQLPPSLLKAIRLFCLSRAVRILRGQETKHCSMMINVSRFNDVQEKVLGHVYTYRELLKNAIEVNAGFDPATITDSHITSFREDFESEYAGCGFSFAEVLPTLPKAVSTIKPLTVNMKGGALDYSKHKATGLHVIAIGGLALSRGLTLEGLTISYILRNTAASDTLMQMARWFGYRLGYEDVCRVFLPQISLDHYAHVDEATEELRDEIKRMESLGLTPEDFGLKVRQSPLALRVTAANKMRTATELTLAGDYSCRHIEGYVLRNSAKANDDNLKRTRAFLEGLGARDEPMSSDSVEMWPEVPVSDALLFFRKFQFSSAHLDLGEIVPGRSLLADYLSDRVAEWETWDVALVHLEGEGSFTLGDRKYRPRRRYSGSLDDDGNYHITQEGKNRVADPTDARLGLSEVARARALEERSREGGLRGEKAYCLQRQRPLLIVHVFVAKVQGLDPDMSGDDKPIVTLSICIPQSGMVPRSRTYQVNKVYLRQMAAVTEEDDDEALLESEDE